MRAPTKAPPIKRLLMFLVTTALAAVGVVGMAETAEASMQPALCSGYSACIQAGYTDHGYSANNGTSYWHEYTGDNCTNYAAYMEVQNNFSTQSQYWPGDANNWGSYFSSYSNSTPAVGSIAWWGGTQGDHVAYVENITYNSNGTVNSIVVSEDNWGGVFDWRVYLASDSANWPSGFLHFKDSTYLKAGSPLSFSAPGGYYANAPLTTSFTVYNNSNASVSIASLIVAVRDPANVNYDQTCKTNFSLAAGASYTCSITQWWNSVGTYTMWPDWEDTNGAWHTGELGGHQTVTLSAPGVLEAVSSLAISTPSGAYANAPINESFTVKNTTGSTQSIVVLTLSVRDPAGVNYDQACNRNFSLAAGASYTCSLSQSWGSTGTYTMWADWEDTSGNWHQGQLGPNQQITLKSMPALLATSPLTIAAPSGYHPNVNINESFTVKNTTGSTQSIVVLTLSVRDPAGVNYDQACNRNFSLATGASYTCSLSQSWGSTGTYTMWADWEDTSGNWHQGQLGPNQQITLS